MTEVYSPLLHITETFYSVKNDRQYKDRLDTSAKMVNSVDAKTCKALNYIHCFATSTHFKEAEAT